MSNIVEMENVTKSYPGFELGPLNLTLKAGTALAYIGPNGSGKSTTMHALMGLIAIDSGAIRIQGQDTDPEQPYWKNSVGYVGDAHFFFEQWTGQQNLDYISRFYSEWSSKRATELAARLELPLHQKAQAMSTGNRVKLSLVSTLAYSPALLLLDEPMNGLDPLIRTEFQDILFEILESGDRTIIYSTHVISEVSGLADELIFLNKGQITNRSIKDELLEQWSKISFLLPGEVPEFIGAVEHRRSGMEHQLISSVKEQTLAQLRSLNAEHIEHSDLKIEDISVHMLKLQRKARQS